MPNESYTTEPRTATGRLGDEASMIAHAADYGVAWAPMPTLPEPPPSTVVWKDVQWPRWHIGHPQRWTARDRNRLG